MDRRYYTPKEVAAMLIMSKDAVVDSVNRGEIPGVRVSPRIIRIPVAGLELHLAGSRPVRRNVTIRPVMGAPDFGAGESLPDTVSLGHVTGRKLSDGPIAKI